MSSFPYHLLITINTELLLNALLYLAARGCMICPKNEFHMHLQKSNKRTLSNKTTRKDVAVAMTWDLGGWVLNRARDTSQSDHILLSDSEKQIDPKVFNPEVNGLGCWSAATHQPFSSRGVGITSPRPLDACHRPEAARSVGRVTSPVRI